MTPNNTHSISSKNNQIIQKKLRKINFNKHEVESGFRQRRPRKIDGKLILISFLIMAMKGKNTFQHWAEHISLLTGMTLSRQGLWKRVNVSLSMFLSAVLLDLLEQQMLDVRKHLRTHKGYLAPYQRVLLQDSTTLALPAWLKYCYPGNVSKGKKKSQLKLQVVYDIISESFVHFEVTAFNVNDQSQSKGIIPLTNKNDLVIRDLGYFVLDCFEEMAQQHIKFISRLRYGLNIYSINKEEPLQILKILKKKGGFNDWVMIGKKQKLRVRLVAIKLSRTQAESRRRKAKKDRDKRLNHSKEYYELLGYLFFITSEEEKLISTKQIAELYGLRWRIETIFKCWKSYFHLQKLIPQNCSLIKERVDSIIYMFLIFVLLFHVTYYNYLIAIVKDNENILLSISKLSKFIANHIDLFLFENTDDLIPKIMYYCQYDKRLDRRNYLQKFNLS